MKYNLICLVLIFFLATGCNLFCQTPASLGTTDGSSYDISTNSALGLHNYKRPNKLDYDEIDGSPYLLDDYVMGKAMRTDGVYIDSLEMKYDLATFNFLALDDDGSDIAINGRYYREFVLEIEGQEVLFKRVDPKHPDRFYEIIFEGENLTIYKDEEVSMVKGEDQGISKSKDRFFKKTKYKIRKGKNIERVKLKKKDLWKHFDDAQKQKLDEYIKKNKVKLKKTEDYRSLFKILRNTP